jgi:O-antigen ligase
MLKNLLRLPAFLTILFPLFLVAGGAAADVAISIIAVLFLVRSYLEKDWAWTKEVWVQLLALLWVYMIVRSIFAENPIVALQRSLPFVRYFVFAAALAFWTLQDDEVRSRFLYVLTALVFFLACDGVIQWWFGKDIFLQQIRVSEGHYRLTGPFHHGREILGIMLVWLSFPVCMRLLMSEEGKIAVTYKSAAILLIMLTVVLSGERMALLLFLFGWAIAIFILPVRRIYVLSIFCAGLLIIAAVSLLSTEVFLRQIASTVDVLEDWHGSPYGKLLDSDIAIAKKNPLFGIGANHFRIVCKETYSSPDVCNIHPHNIYMEWIIEQGAIGFTLFLAFVIAVFDKCRKHWRALHIQPAFIGFFLALIMRLWPLASSTGFFSRWGGPPFWLVLGALLVYTVMNQRKTEKGI